MLKKHYCSLVNKLSDPNGSVWNFRPGWRSTLRSLWALTQSSDGTKCCTELCGTLLRLWPRMKFPFSCYTAVNQSEHSDVNHSDTFTDIRCSRMTTFRIISQLTCCSWMMSQHLLTAQWLWLLHCAVWFIQMCIMKTFSCSTSFSDGTFSRLSLERFDVFRCSENEFCTAVQ